MGFETSRATSCYWIDDWFEVSLWDLKPSVDVVFRSISTVWSIPMGFETPYREKLQEAYSVWSIPMGFETHYANHWGAGEDSVWSIPMGFETGGEIFGALWIYVWSIPMGFETINLGLCPKPQQGLKYPYGIWNDFKSGSFSKRGLGLKYPYGIWNSKVPLASTVESSEFEVSLWDLKLCFATQLVEVENVWSIPMGFETVFICPIPIVVFSLKYPYGIWNVVATIENGRIVVSLKYPYGIWNWSGHAWRGYQTVWFEVSLWDLKPSSSLSISPAP